MMGTSMDRRQRKSARTRSRYDVPAWKTEDAKARFSALVRRARQEGPQRVTYRGADAVVVLSIEDFERLLPRRRVGSLVEFLRGTGIDAINVTRSDDRGRNVDL